MERKQNCWEFMGCGRGPGSARESGLSVCPSAREVALNGVHGGQGAGRACWIVAGTMCGGKVAGTYATKAKDCQACAFYLKVKEEEHPAFKLSSTLIAQRENAD
jgi:hypothetical protein